MDFADVKSRYCRSSYNGQLGTAFDFQYSEGTITKKYVKFDDVNAGKDSDNFAKVNGVVPLERT